MALLEINDLHVSYTIDGGDNSLNAVEDVSFAIERGEVFGLVGESGCGKSTIAQSILRVLPTNGSITAGSIHFNGTDLTAIGDEEMRRTRWEDISLISQSAMNAFDPVYTIREQLREAIDVHRDMSRGEADARIEELFDVVGIDVGRLDDYPHQFSGGMKQRAMIAMALVLEPDLIIADEPTTALDVISQDTILYYLERLQQQFDASILLITHDMSVVAELCDRTAVMYAGKLAELGPTEQVFHEPFHPYTMGLRNAFPRIREASADDTLVSIPGSPPELRDVGPRCRFADRCPFATIACTEETPRMQPYAADHEAACLRIDELGAASMREASSDRSRWLPDEIGPNADAPIDGEADP